MKKLRERERDFPSSNVINYIGGVSIPGLDTLPTITLSPFQKQENKRHWPRSHLSNGNPR